LKNKEIKKTKINIYIVVVTHSLFKFSKALFNKGQTNLGASIVLLFVRMQIAKEKEK
jgi:hypothetical protein